MKSSLLAAIGIAPAVILGVVTPAVAQVQVTPEFSITPTKTVTPWVFQMAVVALALGALVVLFIAASYLRFAPKFFGRKEAPAAAPGARPSNLARPAAQAAGATRPAAAASAGSGGVAVAERPAPPAPSPSTGPAPEPVTEASEAPTAGPMSEPATQADAVGEAEAAAPEDRPSAKTQEEVGEASTAAAPAETEAPSEVETPAGDQATPPAEAETEAAPAPTQQDAIAAETTATEAEAPAAPAPEAPATPAPTGGGGMDQETFDRVLEEQLGKGVDRRVAEGRARAAAVVAARKKAQG
jgi:hypothetical protein